jgi:hypothetical protein
MELKFAAGIYIFCDILYNVQKEVRIMNYNAYRIFKIIILLILLGILAYKLIQGEEGAENSALLRQVFRIIRHL